MRRVSLLVGASLFLWACSGGAAPTTTTAEPTTTQVSRTTAVPPTSAPSLPQILVTNDEGVFYIDASWREESCIPLSQGVECKTAGEVTQLVIGRVAYAIDDARGGLLFQVERGRSPAWWGEESPVKDTRVWWVQQGSSQARELLVPERRKALDLSLYDSFVGVDGHLNVLYVRHDSTEHPVVGPLAWVDSLRRFDVDTAKVTELFAMPGFAMGIDGASGSRDLVVATLLSDEVGLPSCEFFDPVDGTPVAPPRPLKPEVDCFDGDGSFCSGRCVVSAETAWLAYVTSTAETDWVTAVEVAGRQDSKVFEFERPVWDLDIVSGLLLVNHTSDRSGPNGQATLVDVETGALATVPVEGLARFVTTPIELTGHVVAPAPVPAVDEGFWTVIVESIDSAVHDRGYALGRVDAIEAETGIRPQMRSSEDLVTPGSGYWVLYDGVFEKQSEAIAHARVLADRIGSDPGSGPAGTSRNTWWEMGWQVQWVYTPPEGLPGVSDAGDRLGEIERVSLRPDGGEFLGSARVTNSFSAPSASCIVFATAIQTSANDPSSVPGLFLRDRRTNSTIEVTILPDGSPAASTLEGLTHAVIPRLVGVSADCARVVFAIEDDSGWHLYSRDVVAGTTSPLNPDVPLSKIDPLPPAPEPAYAWGVGRWEYTFRSDQDLEMIEVRRESTAWAVVMGEPPAKAYGEVYRFETATGRQTYTTVYRWERDHRTGWEMWQDGDPYHGTFSRNGNWSVFRSDVPENADDTHPGSDLFLHDFGTNTAWVLPADIGGRKVTGAACVGDLGAVVLTLADGSHALWESGATSELNLPAGSKVVSADPRLIRLGVIVDGLAYVFEVSNGALMLASRSAAGVLPDIRNSTIGFSDDGHMAIVGSSATNLVAGDTNNATGPRPYSVEAGFDLFVVPIE